MALSLNIASQSIEYQLGGSYPQAQSIQLTENYLIYDEYTDYLLTYSINQGSTQYSWLNISSPLILSNNQIDISNIYMGIDLDIILENLELLEIGSYVGTINFSLIEIDANGLALILSQKSHDINLEVKTGNTINTDKDVYKLTYLKSTGILSGEQLVTLVGNSSNENCSISFSQNKLYLSTQNNNFTGNNTIIGGTELAELNNITTPKFGIPAQLKNSVGNILKSFIAEIAILENDNINSSINTLSFTLIKSKAETKSAEIYFTNVSNKNFTVTLPSFLTASVSSGNTSMAITFSTVNSSTLNVGKYTGNIEISYDNQVLLVPVNIEVINFLQTEVSTSVVNFCLDKPIFNFFSINEAGRFVKVILEMKFETTEKVSEVTFNYQFPFFNGKAELSIGEKINKSFEGLRKNILNEMNAPHFFNQMLWYKPAIVKITAQEISASGQILYTEIIENLRFYAGKKPYAYPILSNHKIRRYIAGSKPIISFVSGVMNLQDFGANYNGINYVANDNVASIIFSEEDSLINFSNKTIPIQQGNITFKKLPETKNLVFCQWENQNLAPEFMVFTGERKIIKNFSHVISKDVFSGKEEKYDGSNSQKITINTGFILKNETSIIEELAESKSIFLKIENKNYRAIFITDNLVKEDSTLELIQYDLEFLIIDL